MGGYEIVFVDDGSTDGTLAALSAERRKNSAVKVVVLSRNFGKDAALAAGMNYALGDAVIPIDVDLQDPPEVIPLLVDNWLEGAKIVNALRADRRADTALKRLTAGAFYSAYNRMAERPIPAYDPRSQLREYRRHYAFATMLNFQTIFALPTLS
ncbi:glycosyltransferase family 2 protein [Mesorhizobium sp. M1273]|uniref:glycosyltransferase family 2 protein n=1 Tax=Mesorhizobium sp. M1273 TaxID=2957075 RepID=UPI00333AAAED